MKKNLLFVLAVGALGLCQISNAQHSISGFTQLYNHSGYSKSIGLGANYNYAIENRKRKEKCLLYAGLNFALPSKHDHQGFAYDSNSNSQEVSVTDTRSMYQLNLGAKLYIIGQANSGFGLFFNFGGGYMLQSFKREAGNYDRSTYTMESDGIKETPSDFFLGTGIGIDINISFARLFISGDLILPPNEKNGQTYVSPIEGGSAIRAGLRFEL